MSGRQIIDGLKEAIDYAKRETDELDRVLDAAERLVALLRDQHRGLRTWHEAVRRARSEISI